MLVLASFATTAWNLGDFPGSQRLFGALLTANVVEPHRAHFNVGTAMAARDDLVPARQSLQTALALSSREDDCSVRLNLALVLEGLASKADEAPDATGATVFRDEAKAVIEGASPSCRNGDLESIAKRAQSAPPPPPPKPEEPVPGDKAPQEQAVPVAGEADPTLAELELRMEEGQKAQTSQDAPPGKGRADSVSKPW